jgi:glycosyltransferase involved in cell wall biosynthesis
MTACNQGAYVDAALRSALEQTYEPLEIVVVDDGSTDDTVARVRAHDDKRIRLYSNPHRLGQSANRNRALALGRGELIKFLDGDDLLGPDCVAKMTQLMLDDPAVGLVFSRWGIAIGASSEVSESWTARYGEVHRHFEALGTLNDGRALLAEWLAGGLGANWIGPPSAVMVRRGHVELSGGFGYYVRQTVDADLWARVFPRALVGFVDEPLATYRWLDGSERDTYSRTGRAWLDLLWTLETIARDRELGDAYPEIDALLRKERRQAHRTAMRLGHVRHGQRVPLRPYTGYVAFRLMGLVGRRPETFPKLLPIVGAAQPEDP